MMRVGLASDHGGFNLKGEIAESLRGSGYEVVDFGAHQLNPGDDYPDFIIPLARAVAAGQVTRGVARSVAAALERPSRQTKFLVRALGSSMMFSPPNSIETELRRDAK